MNPRRNRLPKGTLCRRGRNWYIRYRVHGQSFCESLLTADAVKAKSLFNEKMTIVRAEALKGIHAAIPPSRRKGSGTSLLEDLWNVYLDSRSRPQSGEGTLYMYACQVGHFVEWIRVTHPGITRVCDVTTDIAWEFMGHLEGDQKASPGTYNKYRDTLQRTFRYVLDKGGRAETPWDDVRRKNNDQNRRDTFTSGQVQVLMDRATGWMRSLLYLGLYTGQRLRDCCMLKYEQVDFGSGLIHFTPNKTRRSSRMNVELPMHPDLRSHLEELHVKAGRPASGFVLPDVADRYSRLAPGVSRDIQVFIEGCGFPIYREGTGVGGVRAVVRYGFHSLRHHFVSACLAGGNVSEDTVRAIVGGSFRRYNHVETESKRRAVLLLPSVPEGGQKGEPPSPAVQDLGGFSDEQLERTMRAVLAEIERRKGSRLDKAG